MKFNVRAASLATAVLAALSFSSAANAAYTFSDVNGGGSIAGTYPSFTITGSDNNKGQDSAQYTQFFASATSVSFTWSYTTQDCCGGFWDPAGYILNGVETQLSLNGNVGQGSSGSATVSIAAGDTFGWYVDSPDSIQGPGAITINAAAVPEPANVLLMLAGMGAFAALRRRKA